MERETPLNPAHRVKAWWRSTGGADAAEVDLGNATRLAAVVALVAAAFQALFLVVHPPTHEVGSAGWVIAGFLVTGLIISGWTLFEHDPLSVDMLLALAAAGMAQAAVICALTHAEPERQLIVLWLGLCVAISSPPRVAMAVAFAYVIASLPLIGTHVDRREAEQLLGDFLLWAVVATLIYMLLSRMRRQRQAFRRERSALDELAHQDELTGLGNRRSLQQALQALNQSVQVQGAPTATLAIFDIENFKQINDQKGLGAGDQCLRAVAESLRRIVAGQGEAFRWGGDEFLVLLPDRDLVAARPLIADIRAEVAARCQGAGGGPLGTRWGLGELRQGITLDDALAAADLELREQKGREQRPRVPAHRLERRRRFASRQRRG